jgi:hypothetical protein
MGTVVPGEVRPPSECPEASRYLTDKRTAGTGDWCVGELVNVHTSGRGRGGAAAEQRSPWRHVDPYLNLDEMGDEKDRGYGRGNFEA